MDMSILSAINTKVHEEKRSKRKIKIRREKEIKEPCKYCEIRYEDYIRACREIDEKDERVKELEKERDEYKNGFKSLYEDHEKFKVGLRKIKEEQEWSRDTLRSQLKFGMSEDQAVYARESRAKGVCLTTILLIDELLPPQ